jgi:UDP-N-acetylglucosamine acyltransferase
MSLTIQANIHPDAKIGKDVIIEPFATIGADVEIGEGTWVGPNAVIMDGARIGKNCKIFPGAVISAIPQDLKFKGEYTTVEIGDNVTIRECVTINRGTSDKLKTTVGNNCLIMAYVHVAHDCEVGNNCILANSVNLAGHVVVKDWVILEGIVAVQQFVTIGEHTFVAGGSLVRKDVPPYVKAAREPISYVGINAVGLRRRGFSEEQVFEIEDIYREIYVMNNNVSKALEIVNERYKASDYKHKIVEFIKNSERGVIRGL